MIRGTGANLSSLGFFFSRVAAAFTGWDPQINPTVAQLFGLSGRLSPVH